MPAALGTSRGDAIFAHTNPSDAIGIVNQIRCRTWMKTSHLL